jgi:hypothetical protein
MIRGIIINQYIVMSKEENGQENVEVKTYKTKKLKYARDNPEVVELSNKINDKLDKYAELINFEHDRIPGNRPKLVYGVFNEICNKINADIDEKYILVRNKKIEDKKKWNDAKRQECIRYMRASDRLLMIEIAEQKQKIKEEQEKIEGDTSKEAIDKIYCDSLKTKRDNMTQEEKDLTDFIKSPFKLSIHAINTDEKIDDLELIIDDLTMLVKKLCVKFDINANFL